MPYTDDVNNEKKYVPSKWAKEELPTWNEIYNEFFKEKAWWYDPLIESHQTKDLYWGLPHRQLLLGWVCNQFNKMLFEDGFKDSIISWINTHVTDLTSSKIKNVYFMLVENDTIIDDEVKAAFIDGFPIIYTCEIPATKERSIFASNLPSKNIKDFKSILQLSMIIIKDDDTIYRLECDVENSHVYWELIARLIKDVVDYFRGVFVGWKDENGEAITGADIKVKPGCGNQAGFDSAI